MSAAVVFEIKGVALPAVARVGGDVSSYPAHTIARGKAWGFKVAKKGTLLTLTSGSAVVTVDHSAKGYVQKTEVAGVTLPKGLGITLPILAGHRDKWINTQHIIDSVAVALGL
jgi:hypothetical protein